MSNDNPFHSLDGYNNPAVKAESDKADQGLKDLAHALTLAEIEAAREKVREIAGRVDLGLGILGAVAPSPVHEFASGIKLGLEELAAILGMKL